MAKIVSTAQGFVYYVSREGVTGEQSRLADTISAQVAELRRHTTLAHCGRIRNLNRRAGCDGRNASGCGRCWERHRQAISENGTAPDLAGRVADFVRPLVQATKSA